MDGERQDFRLARDRADQDQAAAPVDQSRGCRQGQQGGEGRSCPGFLRRIGGGMDGSEGWGMGRRGRDHPPGAGRSPPAGSLASGGST